MAKKLDNGLGSGELQCQPLNNKNKGSTPEVEKIENDSPSALHDLYRYAINVLGFKASFNELAAAINAKSVSYFADTTYPRTKIQISSFQLYRWWKDSGGNELSPIEKPLYMEMFILRRLFWWIPVTKEIYVTMDNAGGHGTDEAKEQYEKLMKEKNNIIIIWQTPLSPYTNLLDLGV